MDAPNAPENCILLILVSKPTLEDLSLGIERAFNCLMIQSEIKSRYVGIKTRHESYTFF